jgi:hypothetical protein
MIGVAESAVGNRVGGVERATGFGGGLVAKMGLG